MTQSEPDQDSGGDQEVGAAVVQIENVHYAGHLKKRRLHGLLMKEAEISLEIDDGQGMAGGHRTRLHHVIPKLLVDQAEDPHKKKLFHHAGPGPCRRPGCRACCYAWGCAVQAGSTGRDSPDELAGCLHQSPARGAATPADGRRVPGPALLAVLLSPCMDHASPFCPGYAAEPGMPGSPAKYFACRR